MWRNRHRAGPDKNAEIDKDSSRNKSGDIEKDTLRVCTFNALNDVKAHLRTATGMTGEDTTRKDKFNIRS